VENRELVADIGAKDEVLWRGVSVSKHCKDLLDVGRVPGLWIILVPREHELVDCHELVVRHVGCEAEREHLLGHGDLRYAASSLDNEDVLVCRSGHAAINQDAHDGEVGDRDQCQCEDCSNYDERFGRLPFAWCSGTHDDSELSARVLSGSSCHFPMVSRFVSQRRRRVATYLDADRLRQRRSELVHV